MLFIVSDTLLTAINGNSMNNTNADQHPTRNHVAGWFVTDAYDYLARFRCTFYSDRADFQGMKSRRLKAFVDLRLAIEAILKGFIALRQPTGSAGKVLVHAVEKHSHKLSPAWEEVVKLWRFSKMDPLNSLIADCDQLPLSLRYTLDARDFLESREELYYRTIGNDKWMHCLEQTISRASHRLNQILGRRSRVASAADIPLSLITGEGVYRKYRPTH
jgi:hypothetical protein